MSVLCFPSFQLGVYQKAFEHLGNALTYDPANYKVLQALELQGLPIDGPMTSVDDQTQAIG